MNRKVGYTKSRKYVCLEDLEQASEYNSIASVSLDYCGMEHCDPSHLFGPHIRRNYVIHLVLDGTGWYEYQGTRYTLHSGQAFLIPPGIETTYCADEENPWYYCWIGFHGYRSDEFIHNMGFSASNPIIVVKDPDKIRTTIAHMLNAGNLNCVDEMRRMSYLLNVLAYLMENNENYMRGAQRDYPNAVYVKFAIDHMRSHYKEKLSISALADEIGITRNYLAHMSPQEYLISIRLENAANLLANTGRPIREVSLSSGYEDSLAFSKAFKKKYGFSPKQYRESGVQLMKEHEKGDYTGCNPL